MNSSRAQTTSSLTPSSYVGLEPTEEGEKRDKEINPFWNSYFLSAVTVGFEPKRT